MEFKFFQKYFSENTKRYVIYSYHFGLRCILKDFSINRYSLCNLRKSFRFFNTTARNEENEVKNNLNIDITV